jgi:hypothetical protein
MRLRAFVRPWSQVIRPSHPDGPAVFDIPEKASQQSLCGHLTVLNGVRGFAILTVSWCTSSATCCGPAGSSARDRARDGLRYYGVDLFFVLSGSSFTTRVTSRTGSATFTSGGPCVSSVSVRGRPPCLGAESSRRV